MNAQFSVMQHNQKWLVVKQPVAGASLVVAECYLEHYANTITELLTREEKEKYETTDTETNRA